MRTRHVRSTGRPLHAVALLVLAGLVPALPCAAYRHAAPGASSRPDTVRVRLSEWSVALDPRSVPAGPVVFDVTNAGTVPHAFEVEGRGVEKSTPQIQPGSSARLELDLGAGRYETYCPIGKGSHRMLGMLSHLAVGGAMRAAAARGSGDAGDPGEGRPAPRRMRVVGGGAVVQILPGPFPFADSAMAVIRSRPPDQREDLTHKAGLGPYSNNVAGISGDISLLAIDRGATGDSVSGTASFTTRDGRRWRLVMDRVQTRDIPFNPRFGGVIMGLYYHGASGVHTPLVPTIQSSLALWSVAHLYEDGRLVTDDAMVHVMLLSRTRRPGDWALACWDCARQPIEELQLQVTPAPGGRPFEAPGGVLFVNWEKSRAVPEARGSRGASGANPAPRSGGEASAGR